MAQVKAKKALGQHFLTDLEIARKIADTIEKPELPENAKIWETCPCWKSVRAWECCRSS